MANTKTVDYVLLGLLNQEEMTGYQIKKKMDQKLRFFWGGSFGSIYPALNLLVKEKKVIPRDTSVGAREKITYSITDYGRECLEQWLQEPTERDELRYETMLKIFLGDASDSGTALERVEQFENRITEKLQKQQTVLEKLTSEIKGEADSYYYLTLKFELQSYGAYLEWCREAKELLSNWDGEKVKQKILQGQQNKTRNQEERNQNQQKKTRNQEERNQSQQKKSRNRQEQPKDNQENNKNLRENPREQQKDFYQELYD